MTRILFALLTSSFALLNSSAVQAEEVASSSSFTVGAGYQYGGVLGARYHFQNDSHVFSAALGLVGGLWVISTLLMRVSHTQLD
ncbi:hypothetical protein [Shewanella sp. UCD-KL21]|uniref:hypothetical protein n=1 Tax=Shewanella sp. UCD-KL21 TaxID=1917164 RepID=UPI0009707654|nr:hypothetical protein [Shewanella sp. UCD-KL21]